MSNTLDAIVPKIIAHGVEALRSNCIMPRLVNTDYSDEVAQKGDTINIPIPTTVTAVPVVPAANNPTLEDTVISTYPLNLSQNYRSPMFHLTDKEQTMVAEGVYFPMQAEEGINSLAVYIDQYIMGLYKSVYGYVGTAGTTPFASTIGAATDARVALNKQLAPQRNRRMVLNPEAEGNASGLRNFQDMNFANSGDDIKNGILSNKLGFGWFMDQNIPEHTAGVKGGTLTINGAHATTGVTAVSVANSAAGALAEGDILTFAGDSQTYVVGADVTWGSAGNQSVTIQPGLKVALSGSEAITQMADHVVNLAFQRNAIAFASRPMDGIDKSRFGVVSETVVDPVSGVALRLEIQSGHKTIQWCYDVLFGAALPRPELACRVAG